VSSLAFLSPNPNVTSRSSMERYAIDAGGAMEERDGWNVAVSFPDEGRWSATVGFADVSHLGKIELQAGPDDLAAMVEAASGGASLELGRATRARGAWWCPYSPTRAVVLCPAADTVALRDRLTATVADANGLSSVIDITTAQGAMTIVGPLAGELFARFTAIDLRPQATPVQGWRPGSVARTGGAVLRDAADRYLMLFGAAFGQYMWTTVADAAEHLGGGPVGVDALLPLDAPGVSSDGAGPEAADA
jgi:heterotetrameric sarcosine oxidase gamma subunit